MTAAQNIVVINLCRASSFLGLAFGVAIIWQIARIIYNLFLHPLRKFPGPLLQRASALPWAIQQVSGTQAFATQRLHDKYGPVVRITPNHLSFTDPNAWKDIYGHLVGHKSGWAEMEKLRALNGPIDDVPRSIITADREEHSRLRRALAHGFSDSSLRRQEQIVARYVDLLIRRIHDRCADGTKPLNAEEWYNWTTFDITGDLIFGQTFGCLDGSAYHPWIESILNTIRWGASVTVLAYLGFHWLVQAIYRCASRGTAVKKLQEYTNAMLKSRLAMNKEQEDLFEGLVKRRVEWKLSFDQLAANAFILVLAGSETTATALSGATYLLLTNPDVLDRLKQEVRGAFSNVEEINISSVNRLSYMLAVQNEALRMYPPVTSNLVRVVPPGGANIAGRFVAGGSYVEVQNWSINHCKENWVDPWDFNPERFFRGYEKNAQVGGNALEALQSFSAGPRNCIGRNLAYAEMRLILARLVYDFDMKLAEDSKNWIGKQKAYPLWNRLPLNVHFTPVERG
ncbi:isotrichodermin C-15 hydroxylase [Periconia macrospinosa]|uniref:Isotrichodermin C-15 hydroxylase n=1 Tax=Periconia macrospinosa TaxID=97972 RepID=A0A2V1DYM7_9PLEO|nr:isotrichodermin C-15 hydroxylase [Periconia macrospinosa]